MGADIGRARFEGYVADALDALPDEIAGSLDNLVVTVEDGVVNGTVLSAFEGVPRTAQHSFIGYLPGAVRRPTRIVVYRLPVCARCASPDEVAALVRRTVYRELGHYFGFDDDRLATLGWA